MTILAVLFDLDGVLVPTEKLRAEVHVQTVERFGGRAPASFYGEIKGVGKAHELVRRAFIRVSGIAFQEEEYSRTFQEILKSRFETLEPTPGIPEVLKNLRVRGCRLAVVSSSPTGEVHTILERAGLLEYFAMTVCGNEVREKKPSPEAYLLALKRLGVRAGETLAVEDSESGIASAYGAGIRVIGLRHEYNTNHDFLGAWRVSSSAEELDHTLEQTLCIHSTGRRDTMEVKKWTPEKEINWETSDIDTWSSQEIIQYRIREVRKISEALEEAAAELETAAEAIAEKTRAGGRVITVGAGGSGVAGMSVMRELPQNHRDIDPRQFTYRVAGGARIFEPLGCEDLEDSWEEGWQEIDRLAVTAEDVIICISATGRTPYTRGAAERARKGGAYTIGLICMRQTELEDEVDLPIVLDAGPEMFLGATCEKAASAQTMALEAMMDAVVARLGLIEGNRCRARLCHDKARLREEFFRQDFCMTFGD